MTKKYFRYSTVAAALVLTGIGSSGSAFASGFALSEQSGSGLGNAYAGAGAVAEDASTIYWNPAGMSKLPMGKQLAIAGNYIDPSTKFSDGGSVAAFPGLLPKGGTGGDAGDPAFLPNGYFAMDIDPSWKFGLGINVPFGLSTNYDPSWLGRFQAISVKVKAVNINPSLAWKASDWASFGFGVSYQTFDVNFRQAINLGTAEREAYVNLSSSAWGYNLGGLFDIGSSTRLGVAYRSAIKQETTGASTTTAPVPGLAPGAQQLTLTLPYTFSLSLAQQLSPDWQLLADATRTGWSKIQSLSLGGAISENIPLQFKDTMRYSLGVNYRMNENWMLKFGTALDKTPVPSAEARTVLLPDNDRTWLTLGAKYKLSQVDAIDVGYAHVKVKDAPINNLQNTGLGGAQIVTNKGNVVGTYTASVNILSMQYTRTF